MKPDLKTKRKILGQYLSENHDLEFTSDEFLEQTAPLIGYVVHSFSSLEEMLNSSLCTLINERADLPGTIVIHKMPFSAKVDLFNRYIQILEEVSGKTVLIRKSLIDDLNDAGRLRNAVVHAEWENSDFEGYTYVKLDFKDKKMQQVYVQFTPKSLEDICSFFQDVLEKFDDYESQMEILYSN